MLIATAAMLPASSGSGACPEQTAARFASAALALPGPETARLPQAELERRLREDEEAQGWGSPARLPRCPGQGEESGERCARGAFRELPALSVQVRCPCLWGRKGRRGKGRGGTDGEAAD